MEHIEKIEQIPEGWKLFKLGDICTSPQYGYTTSGSDKGTVKLLRTTDITSGHIEWEDVPYCKENPKDIEKYLLKDGDIVISRAGSVGVSYLIKKPEISVFASYLIRFKPNPEIVLTKYFYLYLKSPSYWNEITERSLGIAIPNVNASKLKDIEVPVAPLKTQTAIVSKIEELFSELDKGIESLKTAQQQLKVYRQSVLKWAFEGKLTNDNVKDGELPKGWKWVKLGQVASAIDPQPSHRTPPEVQDGIPYIGIGEVNKETGEINFNKARKVSPTVLEEHINRYSLLERDFIIGKIGTIGLPFRIPIKRFFALSANVVLVQADRQKANPDYLFYLAKSNLIEKQFALGSKATTQAAFGIKKVRELDIPLCSVAEQETIVEQLESRLSIADKLEATITHSLQQAETLRQSILKKAFEGKLVVQEQAKEATRVIQLTPATQENDRDFARKVLAANIIAKCSGDHSFGITKFQKTLHVVEYHAQLDFDSHYFQYAAGPLDKFIYAFKAEAGERGWFTTYHSGEQERFEYGTNLYEIANQFQTYFGDHREKIKAVIDFMSPKSLRDAELASTLYAVWNNFLIKSQLHTEIDLIQGVYDWSTQKAKFTRPEIISMKSKMITAAIVPVGFGREVLKKEVINI